MSEPADHRVNGIIIIQLIEEVFGIDWNEVIEKLEECPYPDECYLPTAIYDNSGEIDPTSLPTTLMGLPIVEVDPPIVLGSFNDYARGSAGENASSLAETDHCDDCQ